jgi:hypothetical protein
MGARRPGGRGSGHPVRSGSRTARRGAAAVLVALGTLLAACSPEAEPSRDRATATAAAQPPATTPQTAAKLLREYLGSLRAPGAAGRLEGGATRAVHDAQRRYTEGPQPAIAAEFAIPRISGYPKWFAAGAVRPGMTGDVAIFVQSRKGARWRVHHLAYLTHPMPELSRDAEGYVTVAEPGDLPARQANALTRRIQQPAEAAASGAPAGGDPATALSDALGRNARLFTGHAWTVRHQASPQGRSYALRTRDGGTVVWYVLAYTFTATNNAGRFEITLSDEAAGLLRDPVVSRSLVWEARYQSVAHAPAEGAERILGIALPGWTAMRGA